MVSRSKFSALRDALGPDDDRAILLSFESRMDLRHPSLVIPFVRPDYYL